MDAIDCKNCGTPLDEGNTEDMKCTYCGAFHASACSAWFPVSESPEEGRVVWIIERHWKRIRPQSYAIHAGTVEYNRDGTSWRVAQHDEAGHGACWWEPESDTGSHEDFCAWAYADDNSLLPDFI